MKTGCERKSLSAAFSASQGRGQAAIPDASLPLIPTQSLFYLHLSNLPLFSPPIALPTQFTHATASPSSPLALSEPPSARQAQPIFTAPRVKPELLHVARKDALGELFPLPLGPLKTVSAPARLRPQRCSGSPGAHLSHLPTFTHAMALLGTLSPRFSSPG